MKQKAPSRLKQVAAEFREHLPYTLFAALIGVMLLGGITFVVSLTDRQALLPEAAEGLFHTMHFFHLFLSAIATTAMFWRHDHQAWKAIVVGISGSVLLCGTSDIFFPYVGGLLLNVDMTAHICLLEHPLMVWPFVLTGVATGFILPPSKPTTQFAHGGHVLISTAASLLYLISFGVTDWMSLAPFIFLLLVAAVMIPCCTSDIVFPMLFTHDEKGSCCAHHRPL